jgi:hypothetical protein
MSFFAGFVDGVFQGKDWREAKDDRKRKREWEIEDREHTVSQRGRAVGIQAQEDQAVSEAEARTARIRESQERAMAGPQQREMSVQPSVPQNTAPEASAPPPPPQRGALSVLGLGDLGTGAAGRSMGEAAPQAGQANPRRIPLQMGEAVPQQTAQAAPPPQQAAPPVQVAQAQRQPDPALVAEGAQIAGVEPYVAGQPRPPRGFSLNNLIASPATASTMPDDRPGMTQGTPYTAAELPGAAPQNMPVSDDHPFKAAIERDRARGGLSSAADSQNPQIGRRIALGVADIADRVASPGIDPQSPEFQEFQRQNPQAAQQALEQDRAMRERQAGRQVEREAIAPGRARGDSPQGGAAPTQPSRTPAQQAEQRERAAGAYSFNLGGAEMNISRAQRKLTGTVADTAAEIAGAFGADTGSLKAAGEAIAKSPALSAADALQGDKPKQAEVRAMAKQASVRFQKEEVDRHARVLESEGMFKEAAAWREYAQTENTRKAMEKLSEAMFYWNMNDEGRALQSVVELYNMNGYYDDGLSALSEGTAFQYDAQGNISGLTVTFRDEATGEVFQQTINGPRDKVMALVIGGLSPEATFAAALEAVGGIGGPQEEAPKMTPELSLKIESEARQQAKETSGLQSPSQADIEAARARIMRNMGLPTNADVPLMD